MYAAQALGEIGDPRAVEPLINALNDRDWIVRGASAEALGKIGDPRAVEPLIRALDDDEWSSRNKVIEALGNIQDIRVVKPLIRALKGENWRTSYSTAFWAVEKVDRPTAFRLLLKESEQGDAKTMKRVKKVLKKIKTYICPGCGRQVDLTENHEYCPFCEKKFEMEA